MKKLASLFLALALCLGLAVPALADEEPPIPAEEGVKNIEWKSNMLDDNGDNLAEQDLFVEQDVMLWKGDTNFPLIGYVATTKDEVFTVKNTMTQDDGSYIYVYGLGYENHGGTYSMEGAGDDMYLIEGRGLIRWEEQMPAPQEIKAGESVTFKLPIDQYNEGTYFEIHVVMYLAKYDWSFEVYSTFRVDEAKVAAAKAAKNTPSDGKFSDVPTTSPFAEAINWAVEQKIANGKTETTFAPNAYCSIRHILTFLWRANGRPGDNGDESAAVRAWGNQLGLQDVESNFCSRATAVMYLWVAAGRPEPTKTASFTDVSATASYAKAVSWAVEKGITTGTTTTTFSPEHNCTRGQIVTFLYRAMK